MPNSKTRETLTTLPTPTDVTFCCAVHTLSPEKKTRTLCGPFTDEDLGRMLVRVQTALQTHGPEALRSGSPERVVLALIPEVLELRAKAREQAAPERAGAAPVSEPHRTWEWIAKTLTDRQIEHELATLDVLLSKSREGDGHGGSPGEWIVELVERMEELKTEQTRRARKGRERS